MKAMNVFYNPTYVGEYAMLESSIRGMILVDPWLFMPEARQAITSKSDLCHATSFSPSAMSSPPSKSKSGHSRHETALIHGLASSEVQKLSESCVEAKSKAYCKREPTSHDDALVS